jgi:hypothetical protein
VGPPRRRRDRLAIPILALVVLAILLAACGTSGHRNPAGSSPAHTVVRTYTPYDASGQLVATVHDVVRGSCWTSSIAAPVRGAYRCIAANNILDPCFAPPGTASPDSVACLDDPWSEALVLHLTARLPNTPPLGDGSRPWALELANGARCVAATGTVPSVQGVNLAYRCSNGRSAGVVDATSPTVRADYGDPRTATLESVTVTTIWRG